MLGRAGNIRVAKSCDQTAYFQASSNHLDMDVKLSWVVVWIQTPRFNEALSPTPLTRRVIAVIIEKYTTTLGGPTFPLARHTKHLPIVVVSLYTYKFAQFKLINSSPPLFIVWGSISSVVIATRSTIIVSQSFDFVIFKILRLATLFTFVIFDWIWYFSRAADTDCNYKKTHQLWNVTFVLHIKWFQNKANQNFNHSLIN